MQNTWNNLIPIGIKEKVVKEEGMEKFKEDLFIFLISHVA